MFKDSKGEMIQRVQKLLNISQKDTLVVGDGANDLSMFPYASVKVAFCAKPILKEASTHQIESKDLRLVVDIIDSL